MKKRGTVRPGKRKTPKRGRERPHLLAQAVENCSDMIAMADLEGNFIFANQAFLQGLGRSSEECIGKNFAIALAAANPPALLQQISEKNLQDGGWRGECSLARRDGTSMPMFLNVGPVKDDRGKVIGSFGIGRDISQRKRAEKSLRESEEQFRELAENIREVFFVMQANPIRVTYVSPAYNHIWGRAREEIYERPTAWIDSIHPEDRERVSQAFARQTKEPTARLEYRIVRADGSVRWISNRSFPVYDPKGDLLRVVGVADDITSRHQEQAELEEAHQKLRAALEFSERRGKESAKLTELVDILQSCQTVEEAYKITGNVVPTILDCESGALCVTSPSRNVVEAVVTWGKGIATEKTFGPDSCWALRRGKIHRVDNAESAMGCGHVKAFSSGGYVCVPLAAHGETLGVLHLEILWPGSTSSGVVAEEKMETLSRQSSAVGERLSLALANLRLREVLRSQSIRDPLTGLFNRRFMEDSLERELRRAARNKHAVALIMLDIDHFKRFNDTFGHQAGDALLRSLGEFLSQRTRGQDVACRFGGEEFALILAGASGGDAIKRAELLRDELRELTVTHAGQILGKITVSVGVAAYPEGGATAEQLVHAADGALYQAKAEGRDRIVSAPIPSDAGDLSPATTEKRG